MFIWSQFIGTYQYREELLQGCMKRGRVILAPDVVRLLGARAKKFDFLSSPTVSADLYRQTTSNLKYNHNIFLLIRHKVISGVLPNPIYLGRSYLDPVQL